jgi:hypothetical protein
MKLPKKLLTTQEKLRARFTKSDYTILDYQASCHTIDDGAIWFHIHKLSKCIAKTQDGYIIKKREKDNGISYKVCDSAAAKDYFRTTIVMQQRIETAKMIKVKKLRL